jgi:hypothetical protein
VIDPKPMPQLHPLVPPGDFDLETLLSHMPPTRWTPEPHEGIEGDVVKIVETKAFGQTAPVLFLLLDDGLLMTVRCGGVVLKGQLQERKPAPGDRVAIRFNGMRTSQSSRREYADYSFGIRRALAKVGA